MEWFALLIPIFAAWFLKYFYHHRIVWWELLLPMLPVFIIVPLVKWGAESYLTIDKERWGGWCIKAEYFEDWNEYVHRTCTESYSCGTNSDGSTKTCTRTYDCSYVDYHPAEWKLLDSNGQTLYIKKADYERLVRKFKNESFVELYRDYHTNDGDQYVTTWPQTDDAFQTIFTENSYVNRVQASSGTISFMEIENSKELGLYDYPKLVSYFNDPAILGAAPHKEIADKVLQYYNAKLGSQKQIRLWILLFRDKPLSTGLEQESYWKGGNKNEFTTCIGLDKENNVLWCHPFCWSPEGSTTNDILRINVRTYIEGQKKLDLIKAVNYIVGQSQKLFVRKPFKEFDYLDIDTPAWATWLVFILVSLSSGGIMIWVICNEVNEIEVFDRNGQFIRKERRKIRL